MAINREIPSVSSRTSTAVGKLADALSADLFRADIKDRASRDPERDTESSSAQWFRMTQGLLLTVKLVLYYKFMQVSVPSDQSLN